MSELVKKAGDDNFEEILQSGKPVLIDFWADWCGPCKMMLPVVDEVAEEMGDEAIIAKLNVDENPAIAQKFGVMTIPTFIAFNNGEEIARQIGVVPKLKLIEMVG